MTGTAPGQDSPFPIDFTAEAFGSGLARTFIEEAERRNPLSFMGYSSRTIHCLATAVDTNGDIVVRIEGRGPHWASKRDFTIALNDRLIGKHDVSIEQHALLARIILTHLDAHAPLELLECVRHYQPGAKVTDATWHELQELPGHARFYGDFCVDGVWTYADMRLFNSTCGRLLMRGGVGIPGGMRMPHSEEDVTIYALTPYGPDKLPLKTVSFYAAPRELDRVMDRAASQLIHFGIDAAVNYLQTRLLHELNSIEGWSGSPVLLTNTELLIPRSFEQLLKAWETEEHLDVRGFVAAEEPGFARYVDMFSWKGDEHRLSCFGIPEFSTRYPQVADGPDDVRGYMFFIDNQPIGRPHLAPTREHIGELFENCVRVLRDQGREELIELLDGETHA